MQIVKKNRIFRYVSAAFIVLSVLFGLIPQCFAEDPLTPPEESVIHPEDIQEFFDRYIAENNLSSDLISVGYIYTATGERWYHNEDRWYYSASLYKVPLMMLYAEKEANGELTQESEFYGMQLSYIEDEVLTYSNNDIAYSMMLNIASPFDCRDLFRSYSGLPDDYFSWEYRGYSYFSARFMTEVMYTLYSEPEKFPGIADRLKNAQPGHYFRLSLEDCGIEIAQKYGNYRDEDGNDWNHTSGILYTPNPVILTVMTQYGGISELIISDLARFFYDYTLSADKELSDLRLKSADSVDEEPEDQEEVPILSAKDVEEPEIQVSDTEEKPGKIEVIPEPSPESSGLERHKFVIFGLAPFAVALLLLYGCMAVISKRKDKK